MAAAPEIWSKRAPRRRTLRSCARRPSLAVRRRSRLHCAISAATAAIPGLRCCRSMRRSRRSWPTRSIACNSWRTSRAAGHDEPPPFAVWHPLVRVDAGLESPRRAVRRVRCLIAHRARWRACCRGRQPSNRGAGPIESSDVPPESAVTKPPNPRKGASSKPTPRPRRYAYDYFISYSSPNLADAEFVERVLRGRKLRVWVQVYDSRMSEDIEKNISEALLKSRHFIGLLSSHYINSRWAMQEIRWFDDNRSNRGADQPDLVMLDCEPMQPFLDREPMRSDAKIFKNHYRGALYGKANDADRTAEIIRALKHGAAKDRGRLNQPFV